MARPRNTEERRRQITDGLARVMAERSYARASIGAIAREAGIGAGLVHYHFESKQAILVALVERLVAGLEARYQRRLAGAGDDPWARLDAFVDAFVALDDDADPAAVACWARIGDEAARRPEVAAPYRAAVERWHRALTEAAAAVLAAEGRSPSGAAEAAAGLLAAIEGALHLGAAAPGVIPPGTAAGTLRRMARGLLGAGQGVEVASKSSAMSSESSGVSSGMPCEPSVMPSVMPSGGQS